MSSTEYRLITRDKYFSFKEYPKSNNRINRVIGNYANVKDVNKEDLGMLKTLYDNPIEKKDSITDEAGNIDLFPKPFTNWNLKASIDMSEIDRNKYNKGVYASLYVLRTRFVLKYGFSFNPTITTEYYKASTGQWVDDFIDFTDNDFVLSQRYSRILTEYSNGQSSIDIYINGNKNAYLNEENEDAIDCYYSVGLQADLNFFIKYFEFCSGIRVKFFGESYTVSYDNNFEFNSGIEDANASSYTLDDNPLIQENSYYISDPDNFAKIDLSRQISSTIFYHYAQGRPKAELEWIGDPMLKIGDVIKVEPKDPYNSVDDLPKWIVTGITHKFNGDYTQKLYLIYDKREYPI